MLSSDTSVSHYIKNATFPIVTALKDGDLGNVWTRSKTLSLQIAKQYILHNSMSLGAHATQHKTYFAHGCIYMTGWDSIFWQMSIFLLLLLKTTDTHLPSVFCPWPSANTFTPKKLF